MESICALVDASVALRRVIGLGLRALVVLVLGGAIFAGLALGPAHVAEPPAKLASAQSAPVRTP